MIFQQHFLEIQTATINSFTPLLLRLYSKKNSKSNVIIINPAGWIKSMITLNYKPMKISPLPFLGGNKGCFQN